MSLPGNTEHDDQVRIFAWAELSSGVYPELGLMYACPNGAKLPWKKNDKGVRYSPEAARLKAEGLKPGVPDICLPCPVGKYHGFYLELKHGTNKPSPEQLSWIYALNAKGYFACVAYGWEEAIEKIRNYLEGKV
jgi:hypothetical protein